MRANAFATLVTVGIQLLMVPVCLQSWGPTLYGEWLILSAIPAYLVMSDLGFANVAGNEMTMLVARGERGLALETFQTAWAFILLVAATALLLTAAVLGFGAGESVFSEWQLGVSGARLVIVAFVMQVILTLQSGVIASGFRCEGDYALSTHIGSVTRVLEGLVLVILVKNGVHPVGAAFASVFVRLWMALFAAWQLNSRHVWITWGVARASRRSLASIMPAAFAFMAMPLGLAMTLQGFIALIGIMLGPIAVVIFATSRTLSRVLYQIIAVLNSAVWPEISIAYGSGNLALTRRLHRTTCQAALWLGGSLATLLGLSGGFIVSRWTHGKVPYVPFLFFTLLLVAVTDSLWSASALVLLGSNTHKRFARVFVIGTAAALVSAAIVLPLTGVNGAAVILLLLNCILVPYVVHQSLIVSQDTASEFMGTVLTPPRFFSLFRRLLGRGQ